MFSSLFIVYELSFVTFSKERNLRIHNDFFLLRKKSFKENQPNEDKYYSHEFLPYFYRQSFSNRNNWFCRWFQLERDMPVVFVENDLFVIVNV